MDDAEKPKRSGESDLQYAPCPICGSTYFDWGTPTSSGGVWFERQKDEGDLLAKSKGLKARECRTCGNVQLFTKREG